MLPKKYERRENESFREWLLRNLWMAYLDARKHKRGTEDEFLFEVNLFENLVILCDDILERVYKPSRGIAFISHDPVIREIFAAPFRDRIVHHFLCNCVAEWWDKRLIYDSYSCRVDKGTLLAVNRLRKFENQALGEYKEDVFIIKRDLQGYFMSLSRKKLFKRVEWGLKRQFKCKNNAYPREYYVIRSLWKEIIFDDPIKGVVRRGKPEEWKELPKTKSLFHQEIGIGIVIGNLSSQLLSNIFLDALDRFVTQKLGYKYYGRYVDDFYILVPKSRLEQAMKDMKAIEEMLTGMGLKLHKKKVYIQSIKRGVTFLGSRVYPNRILPGPRVIKNYRKAVYLIAAGKGNMDTLVSYMGHMAHMKGQKIQKKIFEEVGWDWKFYKE